MYSLITRFYQKKKLFWSNKMACRIDAIPGCSPTQFMSNVLVVCPNQTDVFLGLHMRIFVMFSSHVHHVSIICSLIPVWCGPHMIHHMFIVWPSHISIIYFQHTFPPYFHHMLQHWIIHYISIIFPIILSITCHIINHMSIILFHHMFITWNIIFPSYIHHNMNISVWCKTIW